ncbi:DUF4268 domain-containing protein [Winogradskyella sp. SYSU M77433]|uniref:DUF4268 domain-containing protein n=1 Tax=Winogradskyella sp. SYSU M77433 TaxID=3042722 RepID=UPI00247FB8F3|nr:DUF4268 domain-containing protein [Winogradskyella sp. SYSU M77433]MDH7913473.1 DUF4268 domain-containing protein [Winogradskyella sp. SYSU M77433]
MSSVEKIIRIPIREAFPYEARSLTPWLCENIDVLGDAIGIELINPEREQSTGSFNVDIKAENDNGDIVVIENQYGPSDHDHLGKLITYLTSFEAKVAIWIVENPKQEHINAISWLNEADNGCDFYFLKIEAIKIGESNPAPLLSKIVGPSEESKQIGKIKKEDSLRHKQRRVFWTKLLSVTNTKRVTTFSAISPSGDAWIGASSGVRGLSYVFWVNQHNVRIELRIDRGKGSEDENLTILKTLKELKQDIEESFGDSLNWDELEGYRVCSIRKEYSSGGYRDEEEKWDLIIDQAVNAMSSLINATKKHIKALRL